MDSNLENLKEFEKAGAVGFGIGSNILNKQMIEKNDFAGIAALAKQYAELVGERK